MQFMLEKSCSQLVCADKRLTGMLHRKVCTILLRASSLTAAANIISVASFSILLYSLNEADLARVGVRS